MNDLVGVHVMASADELNHENTSFHLCKAAAPAQHVHKRPRGAEFQRHIYVIMVFEAIVKGDNVGMR